MAQSVNGDAWIIESRTNSLKVNASESFELTEIRTHNGTVAATRNRSTKTNAHTQSGRRLNNSMFDFGFRYLDVPEPVPANAHIQTSCAVSLYDGRSTTENVPAEDTIEKINR